MFALYTYRFLYILALSLLPDRSHAQEFTPRITDWDEETMYDLEKNMYFNMQNKYDSIEFLRSRYKRHSAYTVGRLAYLIRRKYAQQMHMVHRCHKKGDTTIQGLVRNATSCQRLYYDIHVATEVVKTYYDKFFSKSPPGDDDKLVDDNDVDDTLTDNKIKGRSGEALRSNTTSLHLGIRADEFDDPGDLERRRSFGIRADEFDDLGELESRRSFVSKQADVPRTHSPRNVRKSLRFLGMADHTLRLQQLVKKKI
ncbi:uncharacterized protein LOC125241484 [Leguminivora glycinivorella]|uniref:uncharacterized protein LOC125241484 n=1 Tax=Leguminivora glycinivorella TaxID=1035111 RepID=UPI00200BED3E|nr:uncharacterized protein LOC125241484 [Leguminivora glycinivorella]